MTTPEESWVVDARPVPAELARDYPHAVYVAPEKTFFPSLGERLDGATHDMLLALAKGVL